MTQQVFFVIAKDFPEGNAENASIKAYAKELSKKGYETTILVGFSSSFNAGGINSESSGVWEGVKFRYLAPNSSYPRGPLKKILYWVSANWNAIKLLKGKQSSTILYYLPTFKGLILSYIAVALSGKKVVTLQTERFSLYGNSRNKLARGIEERIVARLSQKILVITNALYAYYSALSHHKVYKLDSPVIVDMDRFKDIHFTDKKTLGYVGSFSQKDDVDFILKAFREGRKVIPELRLLLMGHTTKEFNEPGVTQTGLFRYEDLRGLISSCDTLVVNRDNSEYAQYGFPIKLAEYMATGIPVLMSRVQGYDEVVPESTVFYYNSNDLESFCSTILARYNDPKEANHKAENAYRFCKDHFDSVKAAGELEQLLNL